LHASGAATLISSTARAARSRPNVLLLFPDQLRAASLSCYGETNIQTSVFDSLVKGGAHCPLTTVTNPVCGPSRSSILTGLFPTATGVRNNGDRLPVDIPTVAKSLRASGYATGYVGKWHLDSNDKPGFVPKKRRQGFSWWAAYNSGHRWRHSVYFRDENKPIVPNPPDAFEPFYQAELGVEFMDKHKDQPWFLMMSYGPPHPPGTAPIKDWSVDVPQEWLQKVPRKDITFPPNVPDWIKSPNKGKKDKGPNDTGGARAHMQGYYASILALERSVDTLLAALDAFGMAENTVVVLASDHGELGGSHGMYKKGEPFDEAIRVPMSFRWPGHIDADRALKGPASTTDLVPTILGLAGAAPLRTHGLDLSPWLLGGPAPRRKGVLSTGHLHSPAKTWYAIRDATHTYAEMGAEGKKLLFNNERDPYQQKNLADNKAQKAVQKQLAKLLKTEKKRTKA
jgi:arylsulfatase A-like enzyme